MKTNKEGYPPWYDMKSLYRGVAEYPTIIDKPESFFDNLSIPDKIRGTMLSQGITCIVKVDILIGDMEHKELYNKVSRQEYGEAVISHIIQYGSGLSLSTMRGEEIK